MLASRKSQNPQIQNNRTGYVQQKCRRTLTSLDVREETTDTSLANVTNVYKCIQMYTNVTAHTHTPSGVEDQKKNPD